MSFFVWLVDFYRWISYFPETRSLTKAEYCSMASITCELKCLKGLLQSLGVKHSKAMSLYCDSQPALHLAQNKVFPERTKYIEVDCHFLHDAILDETIHPSRVPIHAQLAHIFSSSLRL